MSGTLINCFLCISVHYLLRLSGFTIINCLICVCMQATYVLTCVITCVLYQQMGLFLSLYMYLEFHTCVDYQHTVWFLNTVCCQFCYCLSAGALFCTLCFVSYILNVPAYILICF